MLEIGDFFEINTDLRINHNSIPHTAKPDVLQAELSGPNHAIL